MSRFQLLLIGLLGVALRLAAAPALPPAPNPPAAWKRLTFRAGGSVEMPANTSTSLTAVPKLQSYNGSTETAIYVAVALQIDSTDSPHPDGHLDESELDELYEHSLNDFLRQQPATRVLGRTLFKVGEQRGLEVQLEVPATAQLGTNETMRALYVRHYIYLLTWRNAAAYPAATGAADRTYFFNSLRVIRKPFSDAELDRIGAYRLKHLVGRILLYIVVLSIIITLIRRFWAARK